MGPQTRKASTVRQLLWTLIIPGALTLLITIEVRAQAERRLVSQEVARHLGLERAWFAQVRLDRSRNRVERAVLTRDRLTVLTSSGVVQEFNALTGETLWIATLGNPGHPSLGPAANDKFVALVNGSTLYVLDRADGRPIIVRPVGGAPGAAPALTSSYVFVPLVNGRIEGYPFGEQKLTPWYYQSYGRAMVPPLATAEIFVWTTDSGHMYVGYVEEDPGVRFRLETGSEIIASPAYRKPYIYAATISGETFAMNESTGARRWKYATGFTVSRAPAAISSPAAMEARAATADTAANAVTAAMADRVYVTSDEPTLHSINAETGAGLWEAPGVAQFAAASRNRVYGVDDFGGLVVLDATTGSRIGHLPTGGTINALVNDQTDRLYLVSEQGTVQCLHEIGAKEPLYHVVPEPQAPPAEAVEGQPAETAETETTTEPPGEAVTTPPADGEDPFGEASEDAGAEAEAEAEMPADDAADEEDPFSGA
jgi:outer membrane protein assembly factor BamB